MAKISKTMQTKMIKALGQNEKQLTFDVNGESVEIIVKRCIPYAQFTEAIAMMVKMITSDADGNNIGDQVSRHDLAEWFVWITYFTNIDTTTKSDDDETTAKDLERIWSLREIPELYKAFTDIDWRDDMAEIRSAAYDMAGTYYEKRPGHVILEMLDEAFLNIKSQFENLPEGTLDTLLQSLTDALPNNDN